MIDLGGGDSIEGYDKINVVLGKNGSGKSRLLRSMDERLSGEGACIRYITPERGGQLTFDASIDSNLDMYPEFLSNTRRSNRYDQKAYPCASGATKCSDSGGGME